MNNCDAIDLVSQDVRQHVVSWRVKQGLNNLAGGIRFDLLVDYAEDSQRR